MQKADRPVPPGDLVSQRGSVLRQPAACSRCARSNEGPAQQGLRHDAVELVIGTILIDEAQQERNQANFVRRQAVVNHLSQAFFRF